MNRLLRGIVAGGLLGLATAGTIAMVGRRRQMRLLRAERMRRERARRTIRMVRDNAIRFGAALKSGTEAFASRWAEKGNWGRP